MGGFYTIESRPILIGIKLVSESLIIHIYIYIPLRGYETF